MRRLFPPSKQKRSAGIALFILLTSLVILSLASKDLIQKTSLQADRVRNYYDRVQAIYLARSTLNLARFFLLFDSFLDSQAGDEAGDSSSDLWASPIPFPVPMELVQSMMGIEPVEGDPEPTEETPDGEETSKLAQEKKKSCGEFFEDFEGTALAQTTDLNRRLNLNDLDYTTNTSIEETLAALMSPDADFINSLSARDINAEDAVRQIRDYMDRNNVEDTSSGAESSPYLGANLGYEPKNRPYSVSDELKLIPAMDSQLYDYLEPLVSTVYIANRAKPAKINLNTVGKEVFQALLKNVSNPSEIADQFIHDREENARVYSNKNFKEILRDEFSLDAETIQMALLGASSDAFLIETEVQVNETILRLSSTVLKPTKKKQKKPVVQMRISP